MGGWASAGENGRSNKASRTEVGRGAVARCRMIRTLSLDLYVTLLFFLSFSQMAPRLDHIFLARARVLVFIGLV